MMDMKYAIVIPDGCADEPLAELGGKTPLQAANIPAMDEIATIDPPPLHAVSASTRAQRLRRDIKMDMRSSFLRKDCCCCWSR